MTQFIELTTEAQWREAFPVMNELRQHLDETTYMTWLTEMIPHGYRLFALRDDAGKIVSVAGLAIELNLYNGRHVYIHDFVTTDSARSKGYGQVMLGHIEALALENDCTRVVLTSSFPRVDAHRFYEEKMDYHKRGYVFRKLLKESICP